MGDYLDEGSAQGSIFPFLSVLCCVIGTMVLILIAGSLNAAGVINAPEMAKRKTEATKNLKDLRSEVEDLSKLKTGTKAAKADRRRLDRLTDLNRERLEIETDVADAQARLEKIKTETKVIEAAPAKKRVFDQREQAGKEQKLAASARDVAQGEVDGLTAERDGLTADREKTKESVAATKTRVLVDGVDGPYALIDLDVDKLTVHSDLPSFKKGAEFTKAEAMGDGGRLEGIAAELARPGNRLHPVLLVRPGAVELHDEAERVFRRWRVDFTREPVDGPWEIAAE